MSTQPPEFGAVCPAPEPHRWQVLDTSFNTGEHFFNTWYNWLQDSKRPLVLHYVALCPRAPQTDALLSVGQRTTHLLPMAQALSEQWFGLLPGFHRFLLADGQVILTLCVGDPMQSLRQLQFQADELILPPADLSQPGALDSQNSWTLKSLARLCRRGTSLRGSWPADVDPLVFSKTLRACGFVTSEADALSSRPTPDQLHARFDPAWTVKTSRQSRTAALPIQRCAVVGAGLAGASVAASLARRGWQVQVLDTATTPAAGASGLPVGLVVPHTSSDDCPLSRLSRAGVRLMLQQAGKLLQDGVQWCASGVLERQVGGTPQLPAFWPPEGNDWSVLASNVLPDTALLAADPGLWHPHAVWVKPAELVQAWLRQPGVTFQGDAEVGHLQRDGDIWHLFHSSGRLLCSAERVVLANACAARPLLESLARQDELLAQQLQKLPATQGMRGLLSWALHDASMTSGEVFPPFPVNGSGSLVPHIPTSQGPAWFMGSSYQPAHHFERADVDNHARNFEHLEQLLPHLANRLAATFESDALASWKGIRCVTADRLPLVGPLDEDEAPSLWLCAGLGSRGLSFSVLCAELLAARMGEEPLPIEAHLAKALNALRG